MTIRSLLLMLLLLFGNSVFARMYQWTEADTGTTQLSGKPPSWYRSDTGGPRVLVFEKGRLIDDTAIELSREDRRDMRKRAFIMAEQDRQSAKEKLVRAKELKEKYVSEEIEEEFILPETSLEEEATADAVLSELERQKNNRSEEELVEEEAFAERMREMIQEWEQEQTENALKQLD